MTYATTEDVQARMNRVMSAEEESVCAVLLEDAAVIIDTAAPDAETERKSLSAFAWFRECSETVRS